MAEAATALKVSERQVRRYVAAGALPALRLGRSGHIRIRQDALDRFLVPVAAGHNPGEAQADCDLDAFISRTVRHEP